MTQPPHGGTTPAPDETPHQPPYAAPDPYGAPGGSAYGQPAYPPPVDPYATAPGPAGAQPAPEGYQAQGPQGSYPPGYPAQPEPGAYPPAGQPSYSTPPQQGGYPTEQGGYPPGQQGYPVQPEQGGYPPPGYPPPYPQQPGHPAPAPDYPAQGPGYPAQGPGGYPPAEPYPGYGAPGHPTSGQPAAQPTSGHPMSGAPTSGQPVSGDPFAPGYGPGQPYPGQPHPGAGYPPGVAPQPGQPGYPYPGAPAPKKKRGVLIAALLAVVLVLCAGGGVGAWLLLRDTESGTGADAPVAAVERFLTAVYTEQNATKAAGLVCSEARDAEAIKRKVDEIKGYEQQYESPRFRWKTPTVADQKEDRATVAVELTMTTGDEKTAQQKLAFTVVKKTGWWVCEVGQG